MIELFTLPFTCLFLLFLYYYYVMYFTKKGKSVNRIPGKMPLPIVGNSLQLANYSEEELWLTLRNMMTLYYPICKLWFFTIPSIFISHPDYMEKILSNTKHIQKGIVYNLIRSWLGDGLLLSEGMKWQKRRKMLTPAFHFSILKQFVEVLIEEGNSVVQSFKHEEETIIENMQLFTSHHTLNAICETSMGTSLKELDLFQQQQYRQAIYGMGKLLSQRSTKPWIFFDITFNFTSQNKIQNKFLNILHSFTEKIIAKRKHYHEQTGGRYLKFLESNVETEETVDVAGIKKKRMALLDILIAESRDNRLTDLDIREEVDTFLFEGHDTVAIGVCFTLLLLAEHKDIQERVRKEVCEMMEENDGKLTMNVLQNLSYLERCLKESLRMYPSVPVIARESLEDIELQPYVVPKGSQIYLFIYDLHHNSNFWPNPEVFDPDRFLPENMQKRHPYSYIPFSAGLRNCIGQRFAMLELKALIASMVYNYYLEPVDYLKDVKFKMDFVLRATRPIRMKIIPIKRT